MLLGDKLSPLHMVQSCAKISEPAPLRMHTGSGRMPYLLPRVGWLWRADSHSELTRVALHVILLHCMSFLSDKQLSCTFFS